jgi:hypothetical protein
MSQNGDCSREYCIQDPCDLCIRDLKLRIVAAIETVTLKMLENTWWETEYRLDTWRATKALVLKFLYSLHC